MEDALSFACTCFETSSKSKKQLLCMQQCHLFWDMDWKLWVSSGLIFRWREKVTTNSVKLWNEQHLLLFIYVYIYLSMPIWIKFNSFYLIKNDRIGYLRWIDDRIIIHQMILPKTLLKLPTNFSWMSALFSNSSRFFMRIRCSGFRRSFSIWMVG